MTRITADSVMQAHLSRAQECLEICDDAGRTLGYFCPKVETTGLQSPFSDEEIEQRRQQKGGRPLADILRDLQG